MKTLVRTALVTALAMSMATQLAAVELGPVDIHGSVSQGYMISQHNNYIEDSTDGTPAFREYGINATWMPLTQLRIGAQLFAREYGSVGNDQPYLDWAIIDYRPWDWLGIRAGKLKVPYGFYNETRDVDALRTEILLPQGVYMEYQREVINANVGAGLYGVVPMQTAGTLSYSLQYGERELDPDNGDMTRILAGAGTELEEHNPGASYAAGLEWQTPVEGLRVGATYSTMEYDAEASTTPTWLPLPVSLPTSIEVKNAINMVGSVEYTRGPLVIAAEYAETSYDAVTAYSVPASVIAALPPAMSGAAAAALAPFEQSDTYRGWYIRSGYRGLPWLEAAVGFCSLEGPSYAMDTDTEDQQDVYVSFRFDVTPNVILKVEQHFIEGTLGIFAHENPDGAEESMTLSIAKASCIF